MEKHCILCCYVHNQLLYIFQLEVNLITLNRWCLHSNWNLMTDLGRRCVPGSAWRRQRVAGSPHIHTDTPQPPSSWMVTEPLATSRSHSVPHNTHTTATTTTTLLEPRTRTADCWHLRLANKRCEHREISSAQDFSLRSNLTLFMELKLF